VEHQFVMIKNRIPSPIRRHFTLYYTYADHIFQL